MSKKYRPSGSERGATAKWADVVPIDKDSPGSGIDQPPDLLSFDHGFTT